jgi:alkyl hydroperoxide reductase subunit AhpC
VLFSHPKDFTPICTTELGYMAKIKPEFDRNFDEVLRVIDSLQLTAKHRVATPVNWRQGEDVIIAGSVSKDEAKQIFSDWKEPKPYIRIVPQPN